MFEIKTFFKSQENRTRLFGSILLVIFIALMTAILLIPASLRLLYRADAQVALGHAKSVRMAFQVKGTERYGSSGDFCDKTREGGVAEGLYEEILELSKAPGDFWVLQTDEAGYQVLRFVYQEGEYTVWYQANTSTYTVYHDNTMISGSKDQKSDASLLAGGFLILGPAKT